jgi:hypothetical protein
VCAFNSPNLLELSVSLNSLVAFELCTTATEYPICQLFSVDIDICIKMTVSITLTMLSDRVDEKLQEVRLSWTSRAES